MSGISLWKNQKYLVPLNLKLKTDCNLFVSLYKMVKYGTQLVHLLSSKQVYQKPLFVWIIFNNVSKTDELKAFQMFCYPSIGSLWKTDSKIGHYNQ